MAPLASWPCPEGTTGLSRRLQPPDRRAIPRPVPKGRQRWFRPDGGLFCRPFGTSRDSGVAIRRLKPPAVSSPPFGRKAGADAEMVPLLVGRRTKVPDDATPTKQVRGGVRSPTARWWGPNARRAWRTIAHGEAKRNRGVGCEEQAQPPKWGGGAMGITGSAAPLRGLGRGRSANPRLPKRRRGLYSTASYGG